MNIVFLSGGSGKRLWPLSRENREKQFLKVFKKNDDTYESMIQRMYRMIREVDSRSMVTIATSESQLESIREQLGEEVGVSVEPCRRDTFPAIALSVAYLHDVKGISEDEAVVVCPVDAMVEYSFFSALEQLSLLAQTEKANLYLIGIEPDGPSEEYGYIIPQSVDSTSKVMAFKEKPGQSSAQTYIDQGALWNSGVFAFKIGYVLRIAREVLGTDEYQGLLENYERFPKISFDFAVVEKESEVQVIRYKGTWKDIGNWNAFTEVMCENMGRDISAMDCENTHIINELPVPLVVLGAKNMVIVATSEGILVADKKQTTKLKNYVENRRPDCYG